MKDEKESKNQQDINTNSNNLDIDDYQKYRINDDSISSISYEEDIEEKMNRLIKFKQKEKNNNASKTTLEENSKEIEEPNKFVKINEKLNKIKLGVRKITNFLNNKHKKFFLKKLILLKKCIILVNIFRKINLKKNGKYLFKKISLLKGGNYGKKNNEIDSDGNDDTVSILNMKIKKLENKKKRENEYLKMMNKQRQKKKEIIDNIDVLIQKQNKKLEKSINHAPESLISSESSITLQNLSLEPKSNLENGIEIFNFTIINNYESNKMYYFSKFFQYLKKIKNSKKKNKKFTKKITRKISTKRIDDSKFKKKDPMLSRSVTNIIELDEEDDSDKEDNFIRSKESEYNQKVNKSQLVEYDLFYKEQFFKNEVFLYDADNIEDKVEAEIEKEMNRLEVKRKLIEKKKLKEVNDLKKLDTSELQKEINELQQKYQKFKEKEEPKVELELNNTEGFLHNGRMLGNYFQEVEEINIPSFAMESEKEIGAKEVIDFKILRKEEVARRYYDYCCCLEERKKINMALVYARYFCRFFVDNWIFDNLSLLIIIANTVLILISDPTDSNNIGNQSDRFFLYFYTMEAILKIISFTFISAEDAYIKDYWNILDFFVVIVGWISFVLERAMNGKKISGLAGLRAFRILRPLKTVKRFKGLKKLVTALLASIGHLGETSIILFFFFLIFSIAGIQMWQGIFYRRCMNVNYGYLVSTVDDEGMCSFDSNCDEYNSYGNTFICAKGYRNPNSGAVNFDNTLTAFVTVFVMVTLEGWTDLFTYVSKTFKDKIYINPIIIFIYFHVFVFVAAFYLINLFLAVTNSEFEHIESSRKELKEKKSFYKLIKEKYDVKEREKKEKKEKERQLKINNNKKSDGTLRELYYKITDEAYHIHKNKRDIPIIYSTVKDMYIMTNKNPEDLYLQTLQIEEEEKFLNKDIKRQQKEIDELIKKKKKEEKRGTSVIKEEGKSKLKTRTKTNVSFKIKHTKTFVENKNMNLDKNEEEIEEKEKDKAFTIKHSKSIFQKNSNKSVGKEGKSDSKNNLKLINSITKIVQSINSDLIEFSIDNTEKDIKDRIANITRGFNNSQNKKKKRGEKLRRASQKDFDLDKFEDLPYEKTAKKVKFRNTEHFQKLKKEKEKEKEKQDLRSTIKSKIEAKKSAIKPEDETKRTILRKMTRKFTKKEPQNKPRVKLPEELSIINDLCLSDIEENLNQKQLKRIRKKSVNRKLFLRQQSLLLNQHKKENNNNTSLISKDDDDSNLEILQKRKVLFDMKNNFNVESKFYKPHSIFNSLDKQRKDNFNKERMKIIERQFKNKKEKNKNNDKENNKEDNEEEKSVLKENTIEKFKNDKSFTDFINGIQKREEMDEIFKNNIDNDSDKGSNKDDNNIEINKSFTDSILKKDDSLINYYDDLSLEDINLLPDNISTKRIFKVDYYQNENINKNLELNKLTQMIRSSFFDRESVNTNINLTTKQQSDHFRVMNEKLNDLLFIDTKKIRGRFNKKDDDLNVSSDIKRKNYDKYLNSLTDEAEAPKKKKYKKFVKKETQLNIKNLKVDPIKEIMQGYQEKIINDDDYEKEKRRLKQLKEEEEKEKEKEILFRKTSFNGAENQGQDELEYMDSDLNLLGSKKYSERVYLNKEVISNESQKENNKPKPRKPRKEKTITDLNYFMKIKENVKRNNEMQHLDRMRGKKTLNVGSKKGNVFIFKAKSIEKNIIKYPKQNSKNMQFKEENKIYTDPLTVKQELIPDNLRGKKYYMNYLYNISDKDLKVRDNFKVDHWEKEILGNKEKTFKKKPLPERTDAYFVFNDKKLNLQKYSYIYHKDIEFSPKDISIITNDLKYMPLNVLEIMSKRLRNFGRFAMGKEINPGHMGTKPTSMGSNIYKTKTKTRSGKTSMIRPRNTTNIISSSSYSNHRKYLEEIMFRKNIFERIYKKIDEFNYKTLSHYFLLEDSLYFQIVEAKRKQELIQKISERNREKENRIEAKDEIKNILEFDVKTNSKRYVIWSGADILCNQDTDENRKRWNEIINSLEDFNMIIWNKNNWIKRFQKLRYAFYILATNDYFDFTILSIVIINSVFMALDGNLLTPEVNEKLGISNYCFNSIFILEYVVKFIGLGPFLYYSDAFTYLDTLIIAFAIVDMATPNEDTGSASTDKMRNLSSQLSFLRVFRIFRVIRLTKILRRLKSMRLIIVSIKKALANVSYIICILIMFILIFQLLGMSLLSGNSHYQSFFIGFYTTYQILTLENWNSLLYEIWPMNNLCFFYFVAWIFIGNYVIFNLFISILLQSFDEGEKEDEDDLSLDEKIERMYLLPAYLNMVKKTSYTNKPTKLKAYRKRFDKNGIGINSSNVEESFIDSKDYAQSKLESTNLDSYYKTSSNENMNSNDISKSEHKNNEDDFDNEENDGYISPIAKQMQYWKKVNNLFSKNECENSLYFLSQTNSFRIFCMKMITHSWFDKFILFMILCSTARLVVDTFVSGYVFVLIFDILDAVFNIVFFLECIAKILAMGFVLDEGSYLRDNWNKIDIIIVLCSIFDFQNLFTKYFSSGNANSSVQFLKVIRLLRTLRPLRFISHNVQLKLIITSLFDSFFPICNALFIVLVVYYMFSIVGISLFYSNMHNCYILNSEGYFDLAISSFSSILIDYEIPDDMVSISNFCSQRYNGIMDTGPSFKFSNIATSIITSYVLSTMEGWPDIMYSYTIYNDYYGIFFIIYNLVVAYFFLNLFTGIMFNYFNEAYKKEQKIAEGDKKAPKYYDFLTQIVDAETHYVIWKKPQEGTYAYILREFADSSLLDNFIMIVIFLNMIFMALNYEGCSSGYNLFLTIVNYVFTGIFIVECLIKLLAYGIVPYFHSGWNKFDFFVVISSIVDLAVANIEGFDASFLKSFQIIRVLRVLRITRVLRLIKSLKGLEKMIQTLSWSLSALANVLLLMLIIFCIFAILGCYFYDGIFYKDYKDSFVYVNEYFNMDNFYYSFLLVFRCATGENWNNIMIEYAFVDTDIVSEVSAYIYFIVSNFVDSIIMLNLFLMVTLQQYDEFTNKNYNPIEKFESFLTDFNNAWNKFSNDEDEGFRIKKTYVIQFFMDFNWKKLNFPEQGKLEHIKRYITELKLRTDDEDYVYYHDVIYKIIFRQMGSLIERNNPDNNTIFKKEAKVQQKIKRMINKYISKKSKVKSKKKHILITYNPMTSHLYFKFSFKYLKTFLNYYKNNLELLQDLEENSMN